MDGPDLPDSLPSDSLPSEPLSSGPQDATADALLKAALEVIAERGLRGATTRAIAQQAGVNEVTLFRKYGHKMGLIRAAVLSRAGSLRQRAIHYTGDLEHDLLHLTREYQQALKTFGPVVQVLITEFPRHPELIEVLDGPRQLFGEIAALLLRYQQEGKLRPEPIATLLPALIGPIVLPYLIPDIGVLLLQTEIPALVPETHVRNFLEGRGTGRPEG